MNKRSRSKLNLQLNIALKVSGNERQSELTDKPRLKISRPSSRMQSSKTARLGQVINPRLKKKRIRHLLKQFPIMSQILGFVGVKESISKVTRLNKLTNSKKFRTEALEACIWRATVKGLSSQDRCWLILSKTKLRRIMKLNYEGFYSS